MSLRKESLKEPASGQAFFCFFYEHVTLQGTDPLLRVIAITPGGMTS